MKPKSTWTLVVLAAGLFVFIWFVERHLPTGRSRTGQTRILPELDARAVDVVLVRPAGELEIRAQRTNNDWQLTRPVAYPANGRLIEALLRNLEELDDRNVISGSELRQRHGAEREFGFEPPTFSIIVQQGEKRLQMLVGGLSPLKDQVFVQVLGREGVFACDARLLRLIPRTPNDWRETRVVNLGEMKFDRIVVTRGEKVIELARDAASKAWRLTLPWDARADNARIAEMLNRLQGLEVAQFVTDDPKADLESYGLQPPELQLSFYHRTNALAVLQFGKSPTNSPELIFARRAEWNSVVLVPLEPVLPWRAPVGDFRDRHLVELADTSVDIVQVSGADEFTLQRQTNGTWQVVGTNSFPADTALVYDLIGSLGAMQVVQFVKDVVTPPDFPSYGLEPPERRYVLQTVTTRPNNVRTNRVIAELIFGATQGDKVFVRRGDENSVYAVKLSDYRRLPWAGWQLRQRRIWNFTENDVARVSVRVQGKTTELLRHGTNQWAFAPGSQGILNIFGVEETIHRLGELTVAIWTACDPPDRASFGFPSEPDRIDVELRKGNVLSVEFGGVSPHGLPYACVTLDGKPWVFEFPISLHQYLQTYLTFGQGTP